MRTFNLLDANMLLIVSLLTTLCPNNNLLEFLFKVSESNNFRDFKFKKKLRMSGCFKLNNMMTASLDFYH